MRSILVTGGAGFIGSSFIHYLLATYDYRIISTRPSACRHSAAQLSDETQRRLGQDGMTILVLRFRMSYSGPGRTGWGER